VTAGTGGDAGGTPAAWPDPRRAFRGPASAALSLEAVIVPFSLLVMAKVEGGLTPLKIALVVVLTLGLVVAIVTILRPWGLGLAVGLQVLMLLGWVVSPSLGVLGVVFCLVWALLLWMRQEVIRRQALWDAPDG
jgi:Protein of unknown function (DUF4233)